MGYFSRADPRLEKLEVLYTSIVGEELCVLVKGVVLVVRKADHVEARNLALLVIG